MPTLQTKSIKQLEIALSELNDAINEQKKSYLVNYYEPLITQAELIYQTVSTIVKKYEAVKDDDDDVYENEYAELSTILSDTKTLIYIIPENKDAIVLAGRLTHFADQFFKKPEPIWKELGFYLMKLATIVLLALGTVFAPSQAVEKIDTTFKDIKIHREVRSAAKDSVKLQQAVTGLTEKTAEFREAAIKKRGLPAEEHRSNTKPP